MLNQLYISPSACPTRFDSLGRTPERRPGLLGPTRHAERVPEVVQRQEARLGVEVGRHVSCTPRDANGLFDVAPSARCQGHPPERIDHQSSSTSAASASATDSVAAAYVASTSSSRSSAPAMRIQHHGARLVGEIQGRGSPPIGPRPRRRRRTGSSRDRAGTPRALPRRARTWTGGRASWPRCSSSCRNHWVTSAPRTVRSSGSRASSCLEEMVSVAQVVLRVSPASSSRSRAYSRIVSRRRHRPLGCATSRL